MTQSSQDITNEELAADNGIVNEANEGSDKFSFYGYVIFHKAVKAPDGFTYHVILYFHRGLRKNSHGRPISNATLAEILFEGLWWEPWLHDELTRMNQENDIVGKLNEIVDSYYSEEMRRGRLDWNRVLRSGTAKDAIAVFQKEVADAKALMGSRLETYRKERLDYLVHDKDYFFNNLPNGIGGLQSQIVYVNEQMEMQKRRMIDAKDALSAARYAFRAINGRDRLFAKKASLVNELAPSSRREEADELREMAEYFAEQARITSGRLRYDNRKNANRNEILAMVRMTPYVFGLTAYKAIEKSAKSACEFMVNALLGSKYPDILEKTKRNRRGRGHPESPPLNETEEFARSLRYEVIKKRS